ncbi:MAG: OsmC family protein [Gemmatimonadota bacterium]|nr:OsmC family protein [Gemmatimonadota bacterium]
MSRTDAAAPAAPALDPSTEKMTAACQRMARTVELRPSTAIGTATTSVRVTHGMTCEVADGDWALTLDMPDRWGGNDRGPNPGVFGRAALGSCLAMAYRRWAAENSLPIHSLEVTVEADYDARGELGLADVTPAYTEVRYIVAVESDASETEVRRVFDLAETRCPYLVVWRDPMPMRRELQVRKP